MAVQWLFVGGPANGATAWVKAGRSVLWDGGDGKTYEYKGREVEFRGRRYMVGELRTEDIQADTVTKLLSSSEVEPIE